MTICDRGAIHHKAGQSLAEAKGEPKKILLIYLIVITVLSLAVAGLLDSLQLKTIAILHDTIEDTDVTAEYLLEKGIPKHIVEAVQLLTKPEDEEYESYLRRVKENPLAKQVKLADLANNTDPKRASGLNEARRKKYEMAKMVLEEQSQLLC